jgi:hypothetical protein
VTVDVACKFSFDRVKATIVIGSNGRDDVLRIDNVDGGKAPPLEWAAESLVEPLQAERSGAIAVENGVNTAAFLSDIRSVGSR